MRFTGLFRRANLAPRTVTPIRRRLPLQLETLEERCLLSLFGNPLFPADNPWNQRVDSAPVAANSATLVGSIGASSPLHPDFGTTYAGALNGIPFNVVPGTQPAIHVVIDAYASESDLVPIPIPANAIIEGDPLASAQNTSDRHLLVYDKDHNIVYETFNTHRPSETSDGQWHADSEAVWDLSKDSFRPAGFTSADAAGLPILPGLVRPDEVLDQGAITHALRFTVPHSDNAYIYPASHQAGSNNATYPRMGERFRLKASFDISHFSPANQVILTALKQYGMIVADNGSGWFISGQPSSRWDDNDLHNLTQILGNNFESVDLTPQVSSIAPNSGPPSGGTQVTIGGLNFSGGASRTHVFFGSVDAGAVTVVSDSQIKVTAPAHASGVVDVTIRSGYGTSAISSGDKFTYGQGTPQPGQLQFGSSSYSVNEGAGSVTITVTRTNGNTGPVAVHYATSDGTATAGQDYAAASGSLSFADGQTSATFSVSVIDDKIVESNETVHLTLTSPTGGATLGSPSNVDLTIIDNDTGTPGSLRFSAATYSVNEGGGSAVITVTRVGGSSGSVTVQYATRDGTATAGLDYTATSGTLTFADGETSKTFSIPIIDDTLIEPNETVRLRLFSPTGGATLGTQREAKLVIIDNDGGKQRSGRAQSSSSTSDAAWGDGDWVWQLLAQELAGLESRFSHRS